MTGFYRGLTLSLMTNTNLPADPQLSRRVALMNARNVAITKRDWAAMDETTRRLAKLDTPTVKQ